MTIQYKKTDTLDTIMTEAKAACKKGIVYNLLLAYEFDKNLESSQFVKIHEGKAKEWQSAEAPGNLFFSHGEYYKGEHGIRHVIEELKNKSASRRALLSLINMGDLLGSEDRAIPSFMLAQFGRVGELLYVSTYFRALEVGNFLPINLTEMSLLVRRISREIGTIKTVRLVILAFQAYLIPDFRCLEKAKMDIEERGNVAVAVADGGIEKLIGWLEEKKKYESEIVIDGVAEMYNAMRKSGKKYPAAIISSLGKVVDCLIRLKEMRASSSDEEAMNREYAEYIASLEETMQGLREMANGH